MGKESTTNSSKHKDSTDYPDSTNEKRQPDKLEYRGDPKKVKRDPTIRSAPPVHFAKVSVASKKNEVHKTVADLPDDFFDTVPIEVKKIKDDAHIDSEYNELKKEIENMPFTEKYGDDDVVDVEVLINRDYEIASLDAMSSEKVEKLKSIRSNLSNLKNSQLEQKSNKKGGKSKPEKSQLATPIKPGDEWVFEVNDIMS